MNLVFPQAPDYLSTSLSSFLKVREDKSTTCVVDTACKFTAGITKTGGHIFPEIELFASDTGDIFLPVTAC